MAFEEDLAVFVSKGDYQEVRRRTSLACCPVATKENSAKLVEEAASNLLNTLANSARKAKDFQAFCDAAGQIVELAKEGGFPCRVKAGEAVIKLYSERMARDQLKRLAGCNALPKAVVSKARAELRTLAADTEFVSSRLSKPAPQSAARTPARV
jgi:hypothetical protein